MVNPRGQAGKLFYMGTVPSPRYGAEILGVAWPYQRKLRAQALKVTRTRVVGAPAALARA